MRNLLKIESDNYFISNRLKEIDSSYEVYYNIATASYEVHSSEQQKSSYCFRVPYNQLDERTLFYAKKTRSENRDKIIKEIERSNELLYEKNVKEQASLLKEILCM